MQLLNLLRLLFYLYEKCTLFAGVSSGGKYSHRRQAKVYRPYGGDIRLNIMKLHSLRYIKQTAK